MMKADRPIFFIGFGRSGSTHIFHVFSFHPALAWLSRLGDEHPDRMWLNTLVLRAFGVNALADLVARKIPAREGWRYWDAHFPGFSEPFRDLRRDDVSPFVRAAMERAVARIATPPRDRVLVKLTGWPRIAFLEEIFPDAKFVHILRDGRAVTSSLVQTEFWRGWKGPSHWQWGPLSPQQEAAWERWDHSFIALAAIQWQNFIDAMSTARQGVRNLLEVKYEDICEAPEAAFRRIAEFCEVDWHPTLQAKIARSEFRNTNYKWKRDLTERQQEMLEDLLGPLCRELGYA